MQNALNAVVIIKTINSPFLTIDARYYLIARSGVSYRFIWFDNNLLQTGKFFLQI